MLEREVVLAPPRAESADFSDGNIEMKKITGRLAVDQPDANCFARALLCVSWSWGTSGGPERSRAGLTAG